MTERNRGKRIVAWIDAVGGFLVCLGDEIVLGQPAADGSVDVPFLADLSRRHAIIRREGEAYVLTPLQRTTVDGRPVTESVVLRDKSMIKLGDAVELRFRKPHALSNTAVLEIRVAPQDRTCGRRHRPDVARAASWARSRTAMCAAATGRATWCCSAAATT